MGVYLNLCKHIEEMEYFPFVKYTTLYPLQEGGGNHMIYIRICLFPSHAWGP